MIQPFENAGQRLFRQPRRDRLPQFISAVQPGFADRLKPVPFPLLDEQLYFTGQEFKNMPGLITVTPISCGEMSRLRVR